MLLQSEKQVSTIHNVICVVGLNFRVDNVSEVDSSKAGDRVLDRPYLGAMLFAQSRLFLRPSDNDFWIMSA